ncbi:MAG: hypothetical protein ACTSYK_07130, partial [Alphaproteobacteria bacterium]
MKKGYLCALICVCLLLGLAAFAGEPADKKADAPKKALTLEEKVSKAHELLSDRKYQTKQQVLALIHEVGVSNFVKPVGDDEDTLLGVVQEVMLGSTTSEGSMTRADVATYLLKDKRPKIRQEALKQITRLALYCDKPYVSNLLFEMYRQAGDDAAVRLQLAKAFCLTGSPDPKGKEPQARAKMGPEEYATTLKRLPTFFKDTDPKVRRTVVENLQVNVRTLSGSGIGALEQDPDPGVRAVVINYYRGAKVKSRSVVAMGLKGLESTNAEENEAAIRYCQAMKLAESRESMFALAKRYVKSKADASRAIKK